MAIQTSQHRQILYNIGDIGLGEQQINDHWVSARLAEQDIHLSGCPWTIERYPGSFARSIDL